MLFYTLIQAQNIFLFFAVYRDIFVLAFQNIHQMNLISFPVRADGFIQGHFPDIFLPAAKHHQQFIIYTASCVGGKLAAFAKVKGIRGFQKTNGAYGDQIIHLILRTLVFAGNMSHQPKISFNQLGAGRSIAMTAFLEKNALFLGREGFGKGLQKGTSAKMGVFLHLMKLDSAGCISKIK